MIGIEINKNYAECENVLDWVMSYCKRNKIKITEKELDFSGWERDIETYISLSFKSDNQANYFLRKGNNKFPYFEFI